VVFVLDSSLSITASSYQVVRDYTYNYTQFLLKGNTNNRAGVILFGDSASVPIDLDYAAKYGEQTLLSAIRRLPYLSQGTNTPQGLCLLAQRPWRDRISTLRLAIVLTDGLSNELSTSCPSGGGTLAATARAIHDRIPQIVVSAIGVANYNLTELQLIATSNATVDLLSRFDPSLLEQNQYYRSYATCFKGML